MLSDANDPVRFGATQRAKYSSLQLTANCIAARKCFRHYLKCIWESPAIEDSNLVPRLFLLCLPWSLGKTLVAAGHVPTQNLGGKKNLLGEMGGRVFCLLLWQTLWVWNPRAVAKNYLLHRGSNSNFADEVNATLFLPSPKYRRLWLTKKFGSREWSTTFSTVGRCKTSRVESKWNQWISHLNLICFLVCAVFWILKSIPVSRPISRVFWFTGMQNDLQFCWHITCIRFMFIRFILPCILV